MVQSVELERRFLCDIKVCLKWVSPGGNLSDHWVFIRLGGGEVVHCYEETANI